MTVVPERPPPRVVALGVLALRRALLRAADRLVPAEVAVFDHANAFGRTRALGALAELGVAEALTAGPATAAELAVRLGLDADALHRVLRAAAVFGFVRLDGAGRFHPTRLARALAADSPRSVRAWVRYVNLASTQAAWAGLAETIRTGVPGFGAVHGRSVWAHFADHPEEERTFAAAMRELTELDAAFVVHGFPWPEQGTLCDVAGGVGTLLARVLAARPALRGVLVDAPGVLAEAEGHLRAAGVRDRVDLVGGDLFARIEATADVYVLKDVLHDWDDERSARLLETVRATMPEGARLVLVEQLQERDEPHPFASLADVQMLTQTDGGRQRSVAELHALLRAAGFAPGPVRRTLGPGLVEAVPV